MRLVLFAHLLGSALWIGGALGGMVIAIGARSEPPAIRAAIFRALARLHTLIIGTGAVLVVTTGILLTMSMANGVDLMRQPRMWVMQGAGLLGGLLVLFVGLPTAVKMGGLAVADQQGHLPPAFEMYRKRLAIVSSVAGVLALIALFAWKIL